METREIEKKINEYLVFLGDIKKKLEIDNKELRIKELENIMNDSSFWNDQNRAKDILSELKMLKDVYGKYSDVNSLVNTINEMFEISNNEEDISLIENELKSVDEKIESLKLFALLNGEFDSNNA